MHLYFEFVQDGVQCDELPPSWGGGKARGGPVWRGTCAPQERGRQVFLSGKSVQRQEFSQVPLPREHQPRTWLQTAFSPLFLLLSCLVFHPRGLRSITAQALPVTARAQAPVSEPRERNTGKGAARSFSSLQREALGTQLACEDPVGPRSEPLLQASEACGLLFLGSRGSRIPVAHPLRYL